MIGALRSSMTRNAMSSGICWGRSHGPRLFCSQDGRFGHRELGYSNAHTRTSSGSRSRFALPDGYFGSLRPCPPWRGRPVSGTTAFVAGPAYGGPLLWRRRSSPPAPTLAIALPRDGSSAPIWPERRASSPERSRRERSGPLSKRSSASERTAASPLATDPARPVATLALPTRCFKLRRAPPIAAIETKVDVQAGGPPNRA
jgi:hypothetical protein